MAGHKYEQLSIGPNVEVGKEGPRIKSNGAAIEHSNYADDAFAIVRGAHPIDDNDFVTKQYLETRADVIVTGQIDGGSPPAAGTSGLVFICTTAGGAYNLNYLYRDNGASWDELPLVEGMHIKTTDNLAGGTVEFLGDHIYIWDEDGTEWVDIGPAPEETAVVKNARITLAYTDTGVNLIKNIPANAIHAKVIVSVTQIFDGTTPVLIVGDVADPDRHMTTQGQNLAVVGVYETTNLYLYGAPTDINVTLTIGGVPTQGQALVYIEYSIL